MRKPALAQSGIGLDDDDDDNDGNGGYDDADGYDDNDDSDDAVSVAFGSGEDNKKGDKKDNRGLKAVYDVAKMFETWDEVLLNLKHKIEEGESHLKNLFHYLLAVSQKPLFKEDPQHFLTYVDKLQQVRSLLDERAMSKIYNKMLKNANEAGFAGKTSEIPTVGDLKNGLRMRVERLKRNADTWYHQQWRELADNEASTQLFYLEKEMIKAGYKDGIPNSPYEVFSFLDENYPRVYNAFCDLVGVDLPEEFAQWKTFEELNNHIWNDPKFSLLLWLSADVNYRKRGDLDYYSGETGEVIKWKTRSISQLEDREALRTKLESEDEVYKILRTDEGNKARLRLNLPQLEERKDKREAALKALEGDIDDLKNRYERHLDHSYELEAKYQEESDKYEQAQREIKEYGKTEIKALSKKKLDAISEEIKDANELIEDFQDRLQKLKQASFTLSKMIAADSLAIRKRIKSGEHRESYEDRIKKQTEVAHELLSDKILNAGSDIERKALVKAFDPNGKLAAFGRALKQGNSDDIKKKFQKDNDTKFAELQIRVSTKSVELLKKVTTALKIAAASLEQAGGLKTGAEAYMSSFSHMTSNETCVYLEYPAKSFLFLKLERDEEYINEIIDTITAVMVQLYKNAKVPKERHRIPEMKGGYSNTIISYDIGE